MGWENFHLQGSVYDVYLIRILHKTTHDKYSTLDRKSCCPDVMKDICVAQTQTPRNIGIIQITFQRK